MAVVADFPGLAGQIDAYARKLAHYVGVPDEAIIGYFNQNGGHFPQTIQELNDFGDKEDPNYHVRRRQPNGQWTPIVPGDTPGTKGAKDPGFKHVITNAEDSQIQPQMTVDPRGAPWGGSWDDNYNKAHPELGGKTGFDTPMFSQPDPGAGSNPASGAPAGGAAGGVTAPAAGTNPFGGQFGSTMNNYWRRIFGDDSNAMSPNPPQTAPGRQALMGGDQQQIMGGNPFPPGSTDWKSWEQANPSDKPFDPNNTGTSPASITGPAAASGASGASGGTAAGSFDPSDGNFNPAQAQLAQQAAWNDAQMAYYREKMNLIDLPYSQAQIETMAMNAAHQAVTDGLAAKKYQNVDLPMVKLQQDQLAENKRQYDQTYGLQKSNQATDATLRGAQLASSEATTRAGLGMQGLQGAEAAGTARQGLAQSGYLGAGQLAQGRAGTAQSGFLGAEQLARGADEFALSGANALNQTALQAIQASAALRGPRNAWAQQQVNRGLNAAGLSSDVGAIAGEYDPAGFKAPQAQAQAASLGTLAADMYGAGGGSPGLGGYGSAPSANDIIRRQVAARVADPYGQGGRGALDQARGMIADPYGDAGRAAMAQAGQIAADPYGTYGRQLGDAGAFQLNNQYSSPSSGAAMGVVNQNIGSAQVPGGSTMVMPGVQTGGIPGAFTAPPARKRTLPIPPGGDFGLPRGGDPMMQHLMAA